MSELPTTKEGLIWKVAIAIAQAEGKTSGEAFYVDDSTREYIAQLLTDATAIVNGTPKKTVSEAVASAHRKGPGDWMGN